MTLTEYRDKEYNKLEEEALGNEVDPKYADSLSLAKDFYKEGFGTAIALDLPVKFVMWIEGDNCDWIVDSDGICYEQVRDTVANKMTIKELYEYWLNNIYKFE